MASSLVLYIAGTFFTAQALSWEKMKCGSGSKILNENRKVIWWAAHSSPYFAKTKLNGSKMPEMMYTVYDRALTEKSRLVYYMSMC